MNRFSIFTKMLLVLLLAVPFVSPVTSHASYDDVGIAIAIGTEASIAVLDEETIIHSYSDNNTLFIQIGKYAENDIIWGTGKNFGPGNSPEISTNGDSIIMVYEDVSDRSTYYALGDYKEPSEITWSVKDVEYNSEVRVKPTGAYLESGWFVEFHNAGNFGIDYTVGDVDSDRIFWDQKREFESDNINPSVTALDDHAMLILSEDIDDNSTYYSVGSLDAVRGTLAWSDNKKFIDGDNASVVQLNNGEILAMASSEARLPVPIGPLLPAMKYSIGSLGVGNQIDWDNTDNIHSFYSTSLDLAVMDDGVIVNLYTRNGLLYTDLGHLDNGNIIWQNVN
ncbi:hypothetical protein [Jeotgalibacillus marinus]|uniref:Bulb-type lectin domain-containing protein n=1 Tax=Jeotgalibacillus marinus TaxID=86667 RepID=A0ABV3Q621_9BACL